MKTWTRSAEGVTFNAAANVTDIVLNPAEPDGFTVADNDTSVTVNGTANENSFVLRAKNKKGVTVKLNVKDQTTAKENVNIPRDGNTNDAKEEVIYFYQGKWFLSKREYYLLLV